MIGAKPGSCNRACVCVSGAGVPGIDNSQLFHSIVSCIYQSSRSGVPVLGQSSGRASIEKNPCLLVTANQPLVKVID